MPACLQHARTHACNAPSRTHACTRACMQACMKRAARPHGSPRSLAQHPTRHRPLASPTCTHRSFPKEEEAILELWRLTDAFHEQLRRTEGKPEYIFYGEGGACKPLGAWCCALLAVQMCMCVCARQHPPNNARLGHATHGADGPPFATGLPHYGHILAGTIKVGCGGGRAGLQQASKLPTCALLRRRLRPQHLRTPLQPLCSLCTPLCKNYALLHACAAGHRDAVRQPDGAPREPPLWVGLPRAAGGAGDGEAAE